MIQYFSTLHIQYMHCMGQNDHPVIHLRTNHTEYKNFKTLQEHGYSNREVLEIALDSIEQTITVKSKKTGEPIRFPRNILSKRNK